MVRKEIRDKTYPVFLTISARGKGEAPKGAFWAMAPLYLFLASVPAGVLTSPSVGVDDGRVGDGGDLGAPGYPLLGAGTMSFTTGGGGGAGAGGGGCCGGGC